MCFVQEFISLTHTHRLMNTAQSRMTGLRKQAVPAVLFLALLGFTFVERPNWTVPPAPRAWTKLEVPKGRSFAASIESPLSAQRGGYLLLNGWAVAASPAVRVVKVEAYIDGELAGATADFIARPDIAANFGRHDAVMSGWQCVVSIGARNPGKHELQLQVTGSDGNAEVVATKSLAIVE